MQYEFHLSNAAAGFYDITQQVSQAVTESGVNEGVALVYCPHTTAGITINENADPDVVRDMMLGMEKAYPDRAEFHHAEGNSAAHMKASATGASATVMISGGKLVLGIWQGVFFCEFDPPRERMFYVKVMQG
ncbi:MAG: secondary thiamine-phosphate synthase enzyme YjbQ [Clostridiales bacterium]|nr:secondary thiamine-phosphate synthase enzyme YjbQ [Clostridiales bacterium]